MTEQLQEARKRLILAEAELHAMTLDFGDELGKKADYRGLDGMDAIIYYLVQKHNWTPDQIRALSPEDLRLVLNKELNKSSYSTANVA